MANMDNAGGGGDGGGGDAPRGRGGGFGRGFRRGGGRGFGRGRGRGLGSRGRDRGDRGDRGRDRRSRAPKEEWVPSTKLGRLVKDGHFATITDIFRFSLRIKEPEIIDYYFTSDPAEGRTLLSDEIMKIKPVQKQTSAGQRTRFKAWVVVGDHKAHVGLGQKCAAEAGIAIRGAHILAKLSLIPVRQGYWGSKLGLPHTIPSRLSGKCGSCRVRLIPAPRGTGIVAANATKKIIAMAGVEDIYCKSTGQSRTTGNFIVACFLALRRTYKVLTPDLWPLTKIEQNPLDLFPVKMDKK